MNQKAALCDALIRGKVLNIKNGFYLFGITNVPREIGRSVERSFDVRVSRKQMEGQSRYGLPCIWVDYFLEPSDENKEGIKKMMDYVKANKHEPKTDKEAKKQKVKSKVAELKEHEVKDSDEELEKFFVEYQNEPLPAKITQAELF